MRLVGDVHRGAGALRIGQLGVARGGQGSQVCNGAAGDEQPAGSGLRVACKAAHPADQPLFYAGRRRSIHLAARVRVIGARHDVAHPGKQRGRAGDAREAARVLGERRARVNVAEQLAVDGLHRAAFCGDLAARDALERVCIRRGADRSVLHIAVKRERTVDEILHQITELRLLCLHAGIHLRYLQLLDVLCALWYHKICHL